MVEKNKPTVKVPISKVKFYGYKTLNDKTLAENTKNGRPELLRTVFVKADVRDTELTALASFFTEIGKEEVISHILVTKNTLKEHSV